MAKIINGYLGKKVYSELILRGTGVENHVLKLTSYVYLTKAETGNAVVSSAGNELKKLEWTESEWKEFQGKFVQAAELWHRRFCLVPPDSAEDLLYKGGAFQPTYMPNVECHFKMLLAGKDAGWPVVVSKVEKGTTSSAGTGPFNTTMGSDSAEPDTNTRYHPKTLEGFTLTQIGVTHEVGHIIGQPHVGELKNTTACQRAIKLERSEAAPDADEYFFLGDGRNSNACYGFTGDAQDVSIASNVMGMGMKFEEINSISWSGALPKNVLTGTWKTVMGPYRGPRMLKSAGW